MKAKARAYIIFGSPSIRRGEIQEMARVLRSGWLSTGKKTTEFEDDVKAYVGAKCAVGLNSCTAGLHVSLVGHGIGTGDEVITTPMTFCASANAIIHSGAVPVFVDIDRKTMNIDEKKIERAITKRTRAIMPVHMAGRPCEMDAILKIARRHKLIVIEDAAHALGATYKGTHIGTLSHATCFSFYVTKNITTAEGGMITTNNKDFAERVRVLSLHGMSKNAWSRYGKSGYMHYDVVEAGFKYNLTNVSAAIGIQQLRRISALNRRRQQIWDYYSHHLKNLPITLPADAPSHMTHARHLYIVLVDKKKAGLSRDEFMQKLHIRGIGSGVHFMPVHMHTYYRKRFGYKKGDFPEAEYIGERTVSLPSSATLTNAELKRIVGTVREILTA